MPSKIEPQKSEVHAVTADASGSPTAPSDEQTTASVKPTERQESGPTPRVPTPLANGSRIVRDDTSDGGPLVIQTGDPALARPEVPSDPFPTDRKPEIDLPIEHQ